MLFYPLSLRLVSKPAFEIDRLRSFIISKKCSTIGRVTFFTFLLTSWSQIHNGNVIFMNTCLRFFFTFAGGRCFDQIFIKTCWFHRSLVCRVGSYSFWSQSGGPLGSVWAGVPKTCQISKFYWFDSTAVKLNRIVYSSAF